MVDKIVNYGISPNLGWSNQPTVFHEFSPTQSVNSAPSDNSKSRAFKIAKFSTLVVLCILIVAKGSFKKLRTNIDRANKNWIDKNKQLENGQNKGPMFYLREGLRKFAEATKAIFNLAPLKDVVLSKAMEKTKPTKFLYDKLTNWFERVSYRTVKRAYAKSRDKIEHAFAYFEEINATKNIPQEIKKAVNDEKKRVREAFDAGFTETQTKKRLAELNEKFDRLPVEGDSQKHQSLRDQVWEKTYHKFDKSKGEYLINHFVSEELTTSAKINHIREINKEKCEISNSLNDLCDDSFDILLHADTFVKATDDNIRTPIKKIANILNDYKDELKKNDFDPEKFFDKNNLSNPFINLKDSFSNANKYDKSKVKLISDEIDIILDRVKNHRRGGLNQIIHLYKPYLTEHGEFQKALKVTYNATNAFDKAVDLESNKMFDKVRDLKIGSAPKDVLMLLLPVGGVGLAVHKADTKEKKRSVMIKYGIPIVGAVAITTYCTIGLISAGPALLIGTLSGLALNQVGEEADNVINRFKTKYKKITSTYQRSK